MRIGAICLSVVLIMVMGQCDNRPEYFKIEERELNSGVRFDSLFMGLNIGMTEKEFYAHCAGLNKENKVGIGANELHLVHEMDELEHPSEWNFYPRFHEEKIFKVPVNVAYKNWSPWNKELWSDKLEKDILTFFEKKYGGDFLEVEDPKRGTAYVKVQGNRRITVYTKDERYVSVLYVDLPTEKLLDQQKTDTKK
ncbi:MAG: hypothetical protein AAFX87_00280 [Bacteroidota bacterium]